MSQSEFEIIKRCFADASLGFAREGVQVGIGDDAAVIQANTALSLSMDLLIADVHFPSQAPAHLIAKRALAVNLSDLAAMAAEPLCFTLGLALPKFDQHWIEQFCSGLAQTAQKFNCPLVGGDLTRCPKDTAMTIAIQVHGRHLSHDPVLRSGAKHGDDIYVTGTVGDGALGLASLGLTSHLGAELLNNPQAMTKADRDYFYQQYFDPEPRVLCSQLLCEEMSSAIDISDGLAGDLTHILQASHVGAVLELEKLPISDEASRNASSEQCILAALFGGDDYELCFTAASEHSHAIEKASLALGIEISRIGQITQGEELRLLSATGKEVNYNESAYDHFV